MQDFDDLQLSNDTLSLQMGIERQRADSLMQRLKQERFVESGQNQAI